MKTPEQLRAQASRYRLLAKHVTDELALAALLELADEYEKLATDSELTDRPESVRFRNPAW